MHPAAVAEPGSGALRHRWGDQMRKSACTALRFLAWASLVLLLAGPPHCAQAASEVVAGAATPIPTRHGVQIGRQHNYKEEKSRHGSRIFSGELSSPPLSVARPSTKVEVIAHWYNDFGLDYTRAGGGGISWYDWRWNHHDAEANGYQPYDPSRHPLLGWYRGDDAKALDWICYWLREYGVAAVNLVSTERLNTATWSRPSDRYFWLHQLFTKVPNFQGLQYTLSAGYSGTPGEITRSWDKVVEFYLEHPNFYRIRVGDKSYPLIFCFELEMVRGALDGYGASAPKTAAMYRSLADRFKRAGYGGVAILGRHPTPTHYRPDGSPVIRNLDQASLEKDGVFILRASYNFEWTSGKSYQELVDNYDLSRLDPVQKRRTVGNVMTSALSKAPHPSRWNYPGHSPELFQRWVTKAVRQIEKNEMPRILTVYNVSEWAEGGPGLVPNMQDGFRYLEALKEGVSGTPTGQSIR